MSNIVIMLVAAGLGALVVLAGVFVHRTGPEENAQRRFFLLLEFTALAMLVVVLVIELIPGLRVHLFWVTRALTPVIFGLILLILIYLPRLGQLDRRDRVIVIALGLAILGLIGYFLREPSLLLMYLPGAAVCLGAAWLVSTRPSRWMWLLPLAAVLLWALFNFFNSSDVSWAGIPQPVAWLLRVSIILAPVFSVAVMAVFTYSGLRMTLAPPPGMDAETLDAVRIEGALRLLAALLLLALGVYSTVWASIWDQTSDGLGGLMLATLISITGIACGMIIGARSSGGWRWSGVLFALIVAVSAYAGFEAGWNVSFPALTEQRAARIAQALERFHQRENRYPQHLNELVPWDLLYVPQPVMFRGEGWCYQGDLDDYRLAAFAHEYFGTPVSLPVYASAGDPAGKPLPCEERLAAMQERYDWTRNIPREAWNPTPAPAQSSGAQGIRLSPIYATQNQILPGDWSPDGRWWFFREVLENRAQVRVIFIDASGQICPSEPVYPYSAYDENANSAWLDGGRLLYLDGSASAPVITPCEAEVAHLDPPPGVLLTRINAVSAAGVRALLQSKDRFWLLDGASLALREIAGVWPVTYDAHWDHAAWDVSGERLAITHLNSRSPKDGSTLYIIEDGQVTHSHKLEMASQQSAPMVEWLNDQELLLHSQGSIMRIDTSVSPQIQVDVIKEAFDLSLHYPDEIHAWTSHTVRDGSGYYLAVWVNKGRDQQLYFYQSSSGQVSVYQPGNQALLLFPDGQWEFLPSLGEAEEEAISFIQAGDGAPAPVKVVVSGHAPRGYPYLQAALLPGAERLLLSSSNGVSLVGLPDGETLQFWETGGTDTYPNLLLSPDGVAALSVEQGSGVFEIPVSQ